MDQKFLRMTLLGTALVLGLSLIVSTVVVAGAFYKVKALSDTISVTGSAQQKLTSDVVKWSIQISRVAPIVALKDGYAQMKTNIDSVHNFLRKKGVKEEAITVNPVTVTQNYGYGNTGEPAQYSFSQGITVESNDITGITALAQDIPGLMNDGTILGSNTLEYYYSKLADLKVQMLGQAMQDARERAKQVAESAGAGLGGLRSAAMGVLQVTPVNSVEYSDAGAYDTTSVQKQITAIVRASFSVR